MSTAIGGYFELELPAGSGAWHRNALCYQSARAAFLALLQAGRPRTVWMPWFQCEVMFEPFAQTGIRVRRYALDDTLNVRVDDGPEPGADDWLLYTNYFGICGRHVDDVLARFGPSRVVIDNSQAFFNAPTDGLATLYSPRKFFGLPDGGYLVTRHAIGEPAGIDSGSASRCEHLLGRLGGEPEPTYASFVRADASLSNLPPLRMSALTQRMLSSIDYDAASARRAENFSWLHEQLGSYNRLDISIGPGEAPLCYPLIPERGDAVGTATALREFLRQQRVYVPTYWPGVEDNENAPAFERSLPRSLLALPCDQRLTREQRERVAHLVREWLG
ncbi:hypothetical protein [Paraburkholderia sp. J76]|uniref:hypothetical protein n=1 Tax=Paraburkholderia sp. J76 TaxID=2805439 RepID=UPI002ABDE3F7|nr:hypothetical protein [Paraburkholderia sp. J76]